MTEKSDRELIKVMEKKLRTIKREYFEQRILTNGLAIVLYWADHGWLCPECSHFVSLVWNRDRYSSLTRIFRSFT